MATIDHLIRNLESLEVKEILSESIDETRDELKKAQIEQLKHGLNSEGKSIGKYRNPAYAKMKQTLNPLPGLGNVDLILTGGFSKGVFVDARDNSVVIESGDSKSNELQDKYGKNGEVLGLSGEIKSEYIKNSMAPVAVRRIRNKILS